MNELTKLLHAIYSGDPTAADRRLPLVYAELRRLASQKLAREAPGHTLDATVLVHEAYLRLVACGGRESAGAQHWDNRGHFFVAAAESMRRILVENARRRRTAEWRDEIVSWIFVAATANTLVWLWGGLGQLGLGWARRWFDGRASRG